MTFEIAPISATAARFAGPASAAAGARFHAWKPVSWKPVSWKPISWKPTAGSFAGGHADGIAVGSVWKTAGQRGGEDRPSDD